MQILSEVGQIVYKFNPWVSTYLIKNQSASIKWQHLYTWHKFYARNLEKQKPQNKNMSNALGGIWSIEALSLGEGKHIM